MTYISITEANAQIKEQFGHAIFPDALIRLGAMGHVLLIAFFEGTYRNLVTHEDENYCGNLVIPPKFLAKIESAGEANIKGASALDGNYIYAMDEVIKKEQLRILSSEIPRIGGQIKADEEYRMAWWDSDSDLTSRNSLSAIEARKAANLLMGFNADEENGEKIQRDQDSWREPTEVDFKKLLERFESEQKVSPSRRTLKNWWRIALANKHKIHPDINEWLAFNEISITHDANANQSGSTAQIPVQGITKQEVLTAFESLVAINLKSAMEDKPKWILDACTDKGSPGQKHRSIWSPVILAIALRDKQLVPKAKLTQAFYEHSFLKIWRDEWREKSDY